VLRTAGDPGREQVVRVLGEVVPNQDVEEFGVAAQVRIREDHKLALTGGVCEPGGLGEKGAVLGQQGCCDQDGSGRRGRGQTEQLLGGVGVAADEAVEEGGLVNGHRTNVGPGADGALTAG
jgi:hypothetical protein